jgi:TonB family protein
LSAVFHVLPNGIVKEVSLLRSSADPEWDLSALDSLKQWRFASIAEEKNPGDRWIRYGIVVQVQEPVMMQLAEILVSAQNTADSLYALLKGGTDFESLGLRASTGRANWSWKPAEAVNLARYPDHVREAVSRLHVDQVTEPIRLGLNYVIIKRYRPPE